MAVLLTRRDTSVFSIGTDGFEFAGHQVIKSCAAYPGLILDPPRRFNAFNRSIQAVSNIATAIRYRDATRKILLGFLVEFIARLLQARGYHGTSRKIKVAFLATLSFLAP